MPPRERGAPRLSYRRRLRSRIFISYVLFGFALAAAFATITFFLRAYLESQLIGNTLQQNITKYANSFYLSPGAPGVPLEKLTGYTYSQRKFDNVPLAWRHLSNGVHDVTETNDQGQTVVYKLAVRKDPDYWFFLKYDTSQEIRSQKQLQYALFGTVILFALLSLLIGAWLSNRVMQPVSELAQRLRSFRADEHMEPLAPHFANDEVGALAAALDDYSDRLTTLVERDREFNSDVSHELRTPLAVIATTTELMLGKPDLGDKLRERLQRVERAARQSTELIEALLLLSRAEASGPVDGETSSVNRVAADVVASQIPQLRGKPVRLHLREDARVAVNAPASVLAVALTNLVGNAIKYTQQGEVVVNVCANKVVVEDTGRGIEGEDTERLFQRGVRGEGAPAGGAGLGLAIVRRLCELYGWGVSLEPREGVAGTAATLDFQTAVAAQADSTA
ncbi:MAG TPA: HAMP domain-containing sensor histidine kinase [Rhodanobacteraceae bacterium]|nr:HAMP domain-containing sensor histidine kinase [Rhodanobacteraceae bacterium]